MQLSQQPSPIGASCTTSARTRPSASLHLRYIDIASFAHRHARSYATSTERFEQSTSLKEPQHRSVARNISSVNRYSRRRSWKDELGKQAEDLTPEKAERERLKHIAVAEVRLNRQIDRLRRDRGRFKSKLLYDGQYRSLRRLILSLKRWDEVTEDVRKDSGIDPDDEHWILRVFAALDRSTYARVNALTNAVSLQHDPRCRRYALRLLDDVDGNGPERMWFNWQNFGENKKFYESLLVYMLENKPAYAQDFVTVLATDVSLPDSKFVILADALAYLAKLHVKGVYSSEQGWEATPEANARKFVAAFLLCTRFVDTDVYSQDLLHSLVLLADTADLTKIYNVLMDSKTRLSVGTTLHYASAFGEAGEFRYALQCLERRLAAFRKTERELIVDSERFRWTCAAILRGSMREGNNYHETPNIVAAFVQFGVKMDLLLYDVVMRNAMEAGDFATAFKVFNTLDENGLVPDKYTFSILLHGCTTQSDPVMFKAFAEWCIKKAKDLKDPWLATDCLYYTHTCEQNKDATARDTGLLWQTYLDLFDSTPLQPFFRHGTRSMKDAIDQHVVDPKIQRLAPTPMSLYLMLQTEIQTSQTLGVHYLERLYKTFKRSALKNPHPTLKSLLQSPIVWNAFLHAFCTKTQYASASQVIKDMTAHGTAPNIYSWNMFMQSFFKTGQVAAAERVSEIMRSRGVDPDSYSYGVMVRGYAKAQFVDRIGETMQHLGEEEQLDPDLLRALGQVQKRQDLTAALEKSRVDKEKKDIEEAERKAREEEKRFETPRFASLLTNALRFRPETHWDNGDANDAMEPDDEPVTLDSEDEHKGLQDQIDIGATAPASEQPQPSNTAQTNLQFKSLFGTKLASMTTEGFPEASVSKNSQSMSGQTQNVNKGNDGGMSK